MKNRWPNLPADMNKNTYSVWSAFDSTSDAAEALGIASLPDEVAKTLALDVEYRIHEIVEHALKFMRHSKRTTLSTRDVSAALQVLNIEPLYGYDFGARPQYREAASAQGPLHYIEDEEVDFDKLINEPIPKVPREPALSAHWLAIEGVQPAIPQNPHSSEINAVPLQVRGSQTTHSASALTQETEVKPLVKHIISKELQLYFDRILKALNDDADSNKSTALYSLRSDPGLHQLAPYFMQYVQEKIAACLKSSLVVVGNMLDVLDALLSNKSIFLEPYVQQIVPSVLTILVSNQVGPVELCESAESFGLRDYAASLLRAITKQFGSAYYTLKPRLTRTFLKGFLDPLRSLGSYYGTILGVAALGPEVVRVIMGGNLGVWYEAVLANHSPSEYQYQRVCDALRVALKDIELEDDRLPKEFVKLVQG